MNIASSPAGPDIPAGFVPGNHFDKYTSRNPVYRRLVGGFLRDASALLAKAAPASVLEAGCAEGDLASRLIPTLQAQLGRAPQYIGTDVSPDEIAQAQQRHPELTFQVASIYQLPFADRSWDTVIACEVLEHLERPIDALAEIARVCGTHALISVPREPLWRMLNMARGKYLGSLGNTPGHLQHFSARAILRLVEQHFQVLEVRTPLPWTMMLARR
jgi:ubiquinone/menaquinone biosynthesis C-methylase UbiE